VLFPLSEINVPKPVVLYLLVKIDANCLRGYEVHSTVIDSVHFVAGIGG
jgi:hypothetical protein